MKRRSSSISIVSIKLVALCVFLVGGGLVLISDGHAQSGTTTRVSVAPGGGQATGDSTAPAISADGRYVAFSSFASNLVAGDSNNKWDIFVYDRQAGQTTRVSVATGGAQPRESSETPLISADGRYVAFTSFASELVLEDTNGKSDIFVHDRQTGQTTRVSVGYQGQQAFGGNSTAPAISADGRYVAFASEAINLLVDAGDGNGKSDIFVHDRQTGQTTRVSVATGGGDANGDSTAPAISADGRFVAFRSTATNLGPLDTTNAADIYVYDRQSGFTSLVSSAQGGAAVLGLIGAPVISADGRYIAYSSRRYNIVPGDTNDLEDVFEFDRVTRTTIRVSVATGGGQANLPSTSPAISADGRYVAFQSKSPILVSGDNNGEPDIFLHDRQTGQTTRVSVKTGGVEGSFGSVSPTISADGRYIAFKSWSPDLVPGDTNGKIDIFVHDRYAIPASPSIDLVPVNPQPKFPYCPAFGKDGRTFIVTVFNNSRTTAAPPTVTRLQLGKFYNVSRATPGLAPGTSVNVSFPFPTNPPPGDWIPTVTVDSQNQVPESNESNNTMTGRCIR